MSWPLLKTDMVNVMGIDNCCMQHPATCTSVPTVPALRCCAGIDGDRAGIFKTTALPYGSPMLINFTQHALTRMAERGISQDEVLQTLTTPLLTVPADNGCFEVRGMVSRKARTMKIEYDPQADAMYIRLAAGTVVESDEVRPGVVMDLDANGRVLGIEMLGVSQRADNPREMALELIGA